MWFRWFCNGLFGMFQKEHSETWDTMLTHLLYNGTVINFSKYSITFKADDKTYEVWIANKFYAYGYLYKSPLFDRGDAQFRPSYKVAKKLYELERRLHE